MNETDKYLPTRRTLLSRLRNWDDQEHWAVFFDRYWHLIYKTARQAGLTHTEAEDAVQETIISAAKHLPTFHYDPQKGSFKAWLLTLTRCRIVDQLRKRGPRGRGLPGPSPESLESQADPAGSGFDAAWDEEWEATLLAAAVEQVKQTVDLKQYQIFDLCFFKHWPVATVAWRLGINPGRVYWARKKITRRLQQAVAELRQKPL